MTACIGHLPAHVACNIYPDCLLGRTAFSPNRQFRFKTGQVIVNEIRIGLSALCLAQFLSSCSDDTLEGDDVNTANAGTEEQAENTTGSELSGLRQTGVFLDSVVADLTYRAGEINGITDGGGELTFLPGDSVQFSIGGIQLPLVQASRAITPFEIFDS